MNEPLPQHWKLWIDGAWREGEQRLTVRSPWSGRCVAHVHQASPQDVADAVAAAQTARGPLAQTSRYLRAELLAGMAMEMERRVAEFVDLLIAEAGKPIDLARAEVARAIGTFRLAADEIRRERGEWQAIDGDMSGRDFSPAQIREFPIGVVLGITPFNFPLNLVAHKVAPALAVGAPILLKPAPQAPGPSVLLAEVFRGVAERVRDSNEWVPFSAFQVIHAAPPVLAPLFEDPRIACLSFTGSETVGWRLRDLARGKRVALELGGDAAVIVSAQMDTTELARAADRIAFGAFAYAGQSCISVQRIAVESAVWDRFVPELVRACREVRQGDPAQSGVIVGPVIDDAAAERIRGWVTEAMRGGAQLLAQATPPDHVELGAAASRWIAPTLLGSVARDSRLANDEVFGPIAYVERVASFDAAIAWVNRSRFGIHAGVFSSSARECERAFERLEVGGVVINDVPTYRSDALPYGGVKASGLGREGVRSAMREFSSTKVRIDWRGRSG